MMNVVRSADPKLYKNPSVLCRHAQKRCGYKGTDRGKRPETQTLIDYLYGRVPFSALYPYEEQMAKTAILQGL